MITRAQAEALLTLAESLEACERQELGLAVDQFGGVWLRARDPSNDKELLSLSPMSIRLAVNALIPKQETAKEGCTKPGRFPYCDCDSIDAPPKQEI